MSARETFRRVRSLSPLAHTLTERHERKMGWGPRCGACGLAFTAANPHTFDVLGSPRCRTCARVPVAALPEAR